MLLPRRVLLEERKKGWGGGQKETYLLTLLPELSLLSLLLNRLPSARFGNMAILGFDDLRNAAHTHTQ